MTARLIKLAFAALMVGFGGMWPDSPRVNAAAFNGPALPDSTPPEIELHFSMPALLAWASELSGYSVPETSPQVAYRSRAFFRERVCGASACKAVGWYNDQNVIYLDEQYRYEDQDEFANSLLVHELVHFLQHHSGRFDSLSCDDSLAREREAYAVQNDFLANVLYTFRFIAPKAASCAYSADGQATEDDNQLLSR